MKKLLAMAALGFGFMSMRGVVDAGTCTIQNNTWSPLLYIIENGGGGGSIPRGISQIEVRNDNGLCYFTGGNGSGPVGAVRLNWNSTYTVSENGRTLSITKR